MEKIVFLAPFIPVLALIPPSIAAMWIASRWFKSRGGAAHAQAEIAALREEVAALRQAQHDTQERLDFTERMLAQLREARREIRSGS